MRRQQRWEYRVSWRRMPWSDATSTAHRLFSRPSDAERFARRLGKGGRYRGRDLAPAIVWIERRDVGAWQDWRAVGDSHGR